MLLGILSLLYSLHVPLFQKSHRICVAAASTYRGLRFAVQRLTVRPLLHRYFHQSRPVGLSGCNISDDYRRVAPDYLVESAPLDEIG